MIKKLQTFNYEIMVINKRYNFIYKHVIFKRILNLEKIIDFICFACQFFVIYPCILEHNK